MNDPMLPQLAKVVRIQPDTFDTFTLTLVAENRTTQFPFAAGQFNMLYAFGVGEIPISISGDPGKPKKLNHTIRKVGAVTQALNRLKSGDTVGLRGPFGSRWPIEEARSKDVVIIAGGIGLAPLRPAIYHFLRYRNQYHKVMVLYGTRSPADLLYLDEVQQWRSRFDFEVLVTVDRGTEEWHGQVGVVTTLFSKITFLPENTFALICGPEIMMRFTIIELQKREVPDANIYISMERNMKCGVGFCGHCQCGPVFICKDGPVFNYQKIKPFFGKREL
ncbi:MAG: FAD/NAD(P)-binding protein [bacterium]|nr:FAD/NAD(P)-binding protein [bacterium]